MKKIIVLFTILLTYATIAFSQTKAEIESLLEKVAQIENSKAIIKATSSKTIITYGEKVLPMLSSLFVDRTLTKVYSDCCNRNLTAGEIAMILADHVETMPYFTLTGTQNCLLTLCE
ncbi:MAG: hypothetical protein AAF617_18015, partial [Bacteroidota bacterium]